MSSAMVPLASPMSMMTWGTGSQQGLQIEADVFAIERAEDRQVPVLLVGVRLGGVSELVGQAHQGVRRDGEENHLGRWSRRGQPA